jgi:hypothetical protein
LYYLSRYLFSYELVPLLQAAKQPIILNVCGVGIKMGEIVWDDLQATNAYQGLEAIMQGSRLNDLLGVLFADQESTTGIKYVLFNPNGVSTNFSGSYDKEMKLQIEAAKKTSTPVSEGIRPMIEIISNPPEARLSAFIADKTFNIDELAFSKSDADRLEKITKEIIL